MKLLGIMFVVTLIAFGVIVLVTHTYNWQLAMRIGMSALLVVAAIGRIPYKKGLVAMVPNIIPFKLFFVYFTGAAEAAAAVGLLIPRFQLLTAYMLILLFVLILPANIKLAQERINLATGNNDGPGLEQLWFRIPMQVILIAWVFVSAVMVW